jgi:hypothetical protein
MLAIPEDEIVGTMSFASLTDAAAVATELWSAQHRAFIVETFFFLNGESVVKTQRIFRKHFNIVITEKFLAAISHSYG